MDKKRSRSKHDEEDTNRQSVLCSEDTENQLVIKRTMIREGANDTDLKEIRKALSRFIRKGQTATSGQNGTQGPRHKIVIHGTQKLKTQIHPHPA